VWIFTRYGYFEASAPASAAADLGPVHLACRRRSHLMSLQRAYPSLRALPVRGTRSAGWHLAVPRQTWVDLFAALAADLDYEDFRRGVREAGHCDLAYYEKLNEVADAVGELQGA